LGDSLIYSALFFADASNGLVADKSKHFTYLEARYLSQLLKKKFGREVDILNLSMPASNPTDAYLILSELAARGKLPKVVIYGASPRAMVDNLVPSAGAIGGKLALNVAPAGADATGLKGLVLHGIRNLSDWDVVANKIREYGQLGDAPGGAKVRDFYAGVFWNYYHDRAKVKSHFEGLAMNVLGRSMSKDAVAVAAVSAPDLTQPPRRTKRKDGSARGFQVNDESWQRDLNNYRIRYNPPNFSKLEKQSEQLKRIAAMLEKGGSHFLVVSMPLSEDNRELISPELLAAYQKKLEELNGTSHSVSLIDTASSVTIIDLIANSDFEKSTFLDTAHLNGAGATKLDHKLVGSMNQNWF
jgi:hypothetical protein